MPGALLYLRYHTPHLTTKGFDACEVQFAISFVGETLGHGLRGGSWTAVCLTGGRMRSLFAPEQGGGDGTGAEGTWC
jgi:hypothetical protein